MTVLLVEDEASLASFIQKGLAAEGYDSEMAFDGVMGQRLFDQQPYDVVVLDVNLPGMNDFELCATSSSVRRARRCCSRPSMRCKTRKAASGPTTTW